MTIDSHILTIIKSIKLLILDVDGVLTDGKLYIGNDGTEFKAFNAQDGLGIKRLQEKTNIAIAVISGRKNNGVELRLKELNINHIFLGHGDKIPAYKQLLAQLTIQPNQVAYVGDDLPDGKIMQRVGLSIAVNNAVSQIKKMATIVTQQQGGDGAVRTVCELLIEGQCNSSIAQSASELFIESPQC